MSQPSESPPSSTEETAPAAPESAPQVDSEATSTGDTASSEGESNNATGLILGAVVVVLAIVLAIQVPTIMVKLHFRELEAGITQPEPVVEQEALDALLAEGPDLLTHLADELEVGGPERETFRILLIARVLSPMEGERAGQVLIALTADESPLVRANVYNQIEKRALAKLLDPDLARQTLASCWSAEQDPVAKTCAAAASVRLGDKDATWPLIVGMRSLRPGAVHLMPELVDSLRVALGPTVNLDLKAKPEEVKRQMLAIEATYQEQGGKIPAGQDLKSVLEKSAASASGGAGQ